MPPKVTEVEMVEVGKRYLVPTCRYPWNDRIDDWPVIGGLHSDSDLIGFDPMHYHVDGRFVTERTWRRLARISLLGVPERSVIGQPLCARSYGGPLAHPPIEWKIRRCRRVFEAREVFDGPDAHFPRLHDHFRGTQCKRARGAWVCPHQGVRLNMQTESDGAIICPLHELRIDAATGVVR